MPLTLTDLLLGQVGDRALDGVTPAVSMTQPLTTPAWGVLANLLPYTDTHGNCPLSGGALTVWSAASAAIKSELVGRGLVTVGASALTVGFGVNPVGGIR